MSFQPALAVWPATQQLKTQTVVPLTALIQPLLPLPPRSAETKVNSVDVARCSNCFAYINPFVYWRRQTWTCSICRNVNTAESERYEVGKRALAAELSNPSLECTMPIDSSFDISPTVYVFVVDISRPSYVDLIQSSLLAGLEALPPNAAVILITFSDHVALYNLHSSIPQSRRTTIDETGQCGLLLSQLYPIQKGCCAINNRKELIASTIEMISSEYYDDNDSLQESDRQRCFGAVLIAIYHYLTIDSTKMKFVSARIEAFLSGIPNYGVGALRSRIEGSGMNDELLLIQQSSFYKDIAIQFATTECIGIDLFVISDNSYCDIATLRPLTSLTGGNLTFYDSFKNCSLPHDVYKQMRVTHAHQCLLKIRTPPELTVSALLGDFYSSTRYNEVYTACAWDARKTCVVEFEYTSNSAMLSSSNNEGICIQMAFAYNALSQDEAAGKLQRHLRIVTVFVTIGNVVEPIIRSVNATVLLHALLSQFIYYSFDSGIVQTRQLIQSWLVQFIVAFHRRVKICKNLDDIDMNLSSVSSLSFAPKFCFGLLKHPLFQTSIHPDLRVSMQCLYLGIESAYMMKGIYPILSSFHSPNEIHFQSMYAGLNPIMESGDKIFLLDSLTKIIILFREDIAKSINFPPLPNTNIRNIIKKIRSATPLFTPQIVQFDESQNHDTKLFYSRLIEDSEIGGFTYQEFISSMREEVKLELAKREEETSFFT